MKIGFIGTGNMGGAIIRGYLAAHPEKADSLFVYNHHIEKAQAMSRELGIHSTESIKELIENVDIAVLAVKPNAFESVMPQIAEAVSVQKTLVSIAAGISISYLERFVSQEVGVIRVMPNTPSLVGCGMASVSRNQSVREEAFAEVIALFSSIGKAEEIDEKLIDAVVGVSGSSPAYAYLFIEALADGAVLEGMPRKQAYHFAAQAVLGAAKMVLETGLHPGELKDQVCSPGGTTIEAVRLLEKKKFRSAVIDAVHICAEKSKDMNQ